MYLAILEAPLAFRQCSHSVLLPRDPKKLRTGKHNHGFEACAYNRFAKETYIQVSSKELDISRNVFINSDTLPLFIPLPGPLAAAGNRWPRQLGYLCHECSKLDIEQSFRSAFDFYESVRRGKVTRPHDSFRKGNGPVYLRDYYYVTSLGDRLPKETSCKLCNFLSQMVKTPKRGTYKLLAFCTSESYLFEPKKTDVRGQIVRRPWEVARPRTKEQKELVNSLEHNVFMAVVPEIVAYQRLACRCAGLKLISLKTARYTV